MVSALTIAGFDPTGGAGLQADLRVFEALGVHGLSVAAALTAQSTQGVSETFAVEQGAITAQLETLLGDITPGALKTGMLMTVGAVMAAAGAVRKFALKNLVIDPVCVSTSGAELMEPDALEAMKRELIPLARVVTPNINEAALISGMGAGGIEEMKEAARAIGEMGPETVIITGGHLEGDSAVDIIFSGGEIYEENAPLLEGRFHGTGCAFSAAIAARLALGDDALEAARAAKAFVTEAIGNAIRPGKGDMAILRFRHNG